MGEEGEGESREVGKRSGGGWNGGKGDYRNEERYYVRIARCDELLISER